MVWAEAAAQAPDQWLPNLALGEELHKIGAHAEAMKSYRRAIAAQPEEPAAYSKLGVCLSESGDLAGAQATFEQLRAIDPRSAEASNGLATVALLGGRFEEARRGYLGTLVMDPQNVAARHGLAVIEDRDGGNPAEALRLCEEIRTLAPDTPGNDACISRNKARLAGKRDGGR